MYGPIMSVTYDRGSGPINLELGPVKNERQAAELFTDWINDNRVRLFVSAPRPCTVSHEEAYFRSVNSSTTSIMWAIYAEGQLVGNIAIMDIDRESSRAEIGILIGDKNYWNKGIATASEALVMEYAFNNILPGGLNKVWGRVITGNDGSRKALENVGFRTIGTMYQDHFAFGRWWDLWYGEILKQDWRSYRKQALENAGIISFSLYPGCEDFGLEP